MERRPIASRWAPIYGSGLILFFPGSISGRILAALAGTRARSLPQNKLRCSDYAVSLLAPLSALRRLDLTDERNLARVLALPITPARTARRKPPANSTKRNSSR